MTSPKAAGPPQSSWDDDIVGLDVGENFLVGFFGDLPPLARLRNTLDWHEQALDRKFTITAVASTRFRRVTRVR